LLDSAKVLEILDPQVPETAPSDFAKFGSAEQIIALHIGRKPDYLIWQIRTSIFFKNQIFLDLIENLLLAMPNHSPLYSHSQKHAAQ
jgi:hypothetical protein